MTEQDVINNELLKKFIGDHFSLDRESLERFCKDIDGENIPEEFKSFLGSDFRYKFEITEEIKEFIDVGWSMFKSAFPEFVKELNVNYSNYSSNKIMVEKNQLKVFKHLKHFYNSNPNYLFDFLNRAARTYYTRDLSELIKLITEKIGEVKLPNRPLFAVISRNFADYFLCSTGEKSWSACTSLKTGYENCSWAGLPGLLADKNRVMFYITDGVKKEEYGIKVDRLILRSFLVLTNKDTLKFIRFYPQSFFAEKITIGDFLPINADALPASFGYFNKEESCVFENWESKYSFKPYFNTNGTSNFIFQDCSKFTKLDSNLETKIVSDFENDLGATWGFENKISGESPLMICNYYYPYSFDQAIERKHCLSSYYEDNCEDNDNDEEEEYNCENCNTGLQERELYYLDGGHYCIDCYERISRECEECGRVISENNAFEGKDGAVLCERCKEKEGSNEN